MQRYVQQLIDQFGAFAKTRQDQQVAEQEALGDQAWDISSNEPIGQEVPFESDEDCQNEDFEDYIRDVEVYVAGPRPGIDASLAQLAGIDLAELPRADVMTDEETAALTEAIVDLVDTYGHNIDILPREGCPPGPIYAYVLDILAEPTVELSYGGVHYDCGTHPPTCPFGHWCRCIEHYTYQRFVAEGGDPSIPQQHFKSAADAAAELAHIETIFAAHEMLREIGEPDGIVEGDASFSEAKSNADAPTSPDLTALQAAVDGWIQTTGVRYFNELTNTAILAEEVGEVARLSARLYGEQSFKTSEAAASAKTDWADELSDVLFVLTCLANQTGVDLTTGFAKGMAKRTTRDADRHAGNAKLR